MSFNDLGFGILSRFANCIELCQEGIPLGKETREQIIVHFLGGWELEFGVVDLFTVFPETEADVWSGGQAGRTYVADRFSLLDPATYFVSGGKLLHVQVLRRQLFVVANLDEVSVATTTSPFDDYTVSNG